VIWNWELNGKIKEISNEKEKKINKFFYEYVGGEQSDTDVTNKLCTQQPNKHNQSSYIPDAFYRLQRENVTDWRE